MPSNISEIDLSEPRSLVEDVEFANWLVFNFDIIKRALEDGVDGSFTTADGKTVTVKNGIITSIA